MAAIRSNVSLTLGLISVTVAVHAAVDDDKDTALKTLCQNGHPPTKTQAPLVCPTCDNRDRSTFVKGRANPDGSFVVIDAAAVQQATASELEQKAMPLTTHPAEDVGHHTLPGGRVYYLAPKTGGPSYPLLVELVKRHPEIAFCTVWAPRTRASMYRLGVYGDALTITELAWPEKVREAPDCEDALDERMLPLAEQFIDQLMEPFDPAAYKDRRAETLRAFLAQAETVAGVQPEEAPAPSTDLLAALQAAVKPKPKRKRAPAKRKAS